MTLMGDICKEKIDAGHSWVKGLISYELSFILVTINIA